MVYTGWYYCAEFATFHGIRWIESTVPVEAWAGRLFGPFYSFVEAKRSALDFFRADIKASRAAFYEVTRWHKNRKT